MINIAVVLLLIGAAAMSARALNPPAPDATDTGVWTFVTTERRAVRVGANGQVDTVSPPLKSSSGTVVETPTEIVVLSPGQVERLPKATLDTSRVEPAPNGSNEAAIPAGDVWVFRAAGVIGMPGGNVAVTPPVGDVVTDDHDVVWAESAGQICWVDQRAEGKSREATCQIDLPTSGHLITVAGEPWFVSDAVDTMSLVTKQGLGKALPLHLDLPANAVLTERTFQSDFGAYLPSTSEVVIFTANEDDAAPSRIRVPRGAYDAIAVVHDFFVLVDRNGPAAVIGEKAGRNLTTYPLNADAKGAQPLPSKTDVVHLTQPGGERVYTIGGVDNVVEAPTGKAARAASAQQKPSAKKKPPPKPTNSPDPKQSPTTVPPSRKAERPGAPEPATASAGDASADVLWSRAAANGAEIKHYIVRWSSSAGPGEQRVDPGSTGTHISGLANGVTYVFSVTAVNDVGAGLPATTAPVTPTPDVPGVVTGLTAVAQADGTARLAWTAPAGQRPVSGYRIMVRGGGESSVLETGSTQTTASVSEDDGLQLGVDYLVTIVAVDDGGRTGAMSESAPFRLARPADPPTALAATPAGSGALDIGWQTPSMNGGTLDRYVVTLDGGVAPVEVAGTRVVVSGLVNGRTYTVNVAARTKTAAGRSLNGQPATTTATVGTPPSVSGVSARLTGDRQVNVAFTAADNGSGAVTCHVYFDGAERWTGGCSGAADVPVGGLEYEHSYDIWVTATNGFGSSPDSNHVAVRTNNRPRVTVSKGAPKGCAGCTEVVVTLTDMAPNTRYTVECHSEVDGTASFYTYQVTTNGSGYNQSATCYFGYPGKAVWAVAGGVTSPRVTW